MREASRSLFLCVLFAALAGCVAGGRSEPASVVQPVTRSNEVARTPAARNDVDVIHVFVALCDNEHQGIVPVAPSLGDGDDPARNLYWGAAFGVKTFFAKSRDWQLVATISNPRAAILERLVFKHSRKDAYLVADAYRGREIKQAITDF